MKKTNTKGGIALISLSIVLIILVLISGVITYIGYDIIVTAKNTAYAKDMETITDSVMEYYAVNGSFPILENGKEVTTDEYEQDIIDLLGEEAALRLANEIIKNNDEEAVFYEIDISKIGIDDLKFGIKENENDIYVISNDSHIIYYYLGYENSSGLYFSNSNMMENKVGGIYE